MNQQDSPTEKTDDTVWEQHVESLLNQHDDNEDEMFKFSPPLHTQRKRLVLNVVMDFIYQNYPTNPSLISPTFTILDVGCERGAFFQYFQAELIGIKHIFDTSYIGIDISEFTLSHEAIDNLKPYSIGNSGDIRTGSVSVKFLLENILYPSVHLDRPDALVMIEVIEHIQEKDVHEILPHSIFGQICPRIAIITTPNADFNEIFGLKSRSQFRHWDHKFEWTRNEFQCWCETVVSLYPAYRFQTGDIGTIDQFPLHGGGSQMAVFIRMEPQPLFTNAALSTQSTVIYEKNKLFTAFSEFDVIKNFIFYKMSLWAVEKHVSIFDIPEMFLDENEKYLCETNPNLGILEYDDECSYEIFKISLSVIERIVKGNYPNSTVDMVDLLQKCTESSIYFKLSDDKQYICYVTQLENDDFEEEEEYMKKHSNFYENVQYLCDKVEDVDLTEF